MINKVRKKKITKSKCIILKVFFYSDVYKRIIELLFEFKWPALCKKISNIQGVLTENMHTIQQLAVVFLCENKYK